MGTSIVDFKDLARRGRERYDRDIRPILEPNPANFGKMVAVHPDTGAYEVGDDSEIVLDKMRTRFPQALFHVVRVGYPTAFRIGFRLSPADAVPDA